MVILWAIVLAILSMLARSSIHYVCLMGFVGRGGIVMLLIVCKGLTCGLLWRCVCEL